MELRDTAALVTGGASGLGLATGLRLAAAGAHVVLADRAPVDAKVEKGCPGSVTGILADVTDEVQMAAALDTASRLGPLRVLVNCAGVVTPGRVLSHKGTVLSLDTFKQVVMVNLVGTFNAIRLAAERMAAAAPAGEERGVIVNTASIAAFDGQIGQAAYSASKGGVVGMTLPVARDLAGKLIRVVTIAPGLFRTPAMAGLPEEAQESLAAQVPHPARLGEASEFAALVEHVVANPMLNGEVIRLDGAIRMAPR
ncbi:SDR family NAD(P)-dependent oxidoreductase [Amycolatopsis pigmentata]|uniref:SDR family NAD(P)-dependent oxidoreductase n=1 Tax=Amycolatopsis pigmentata TaxID=450801 RepID=A0ABW5FNA0_9PSEU